MRKITILSVVTFAVIFGLTSLTNETKAQSATKVKEIIEKSNNNFMQWFNNGEIDLLSKLYRDDACLVARGCGKTFVKNYYEAESRKYKFSDLSVISVSVSDTIAVEKGRWEITLESGEKIRGEYLSEWRMTGKKWLIVNELSGISIN